MANLLEYAKKYDVPLDTQGRPAFGEGKSGLTPLSPTNPATLIVETDVEQRDYIEYNQQLSLFGFTTRQLFDLDAITTRQMKALSITTPVHPMFQKNRWLKGARPIVSVVYIGCLHI